MAASLSLGAFVFLSSFFFLSPQTPPPICFCCSSNWTWYQSAFGPVHFPKTCRSPIPLEERLVCALACVSRLCWCGVPLFSFRLSCLFPRYYILHCRPPPPPSFPGPGRSTACTEVGPKPTTLRRSPKSFLGFGRARSSAKITSCFAERQVAVGPLPFDWQFGFALLSMFIFGASCPFDVFVRGGRVDVTCSSFCFFSCLLCGVSKND